MDTLGDLFRLLLGRAVYIKALTEAVELKKGYMPTIAESAVEVGIN